MKFNKKQILAMLAVVALVGVPAASAAAGFGLNPGADSYPETKITEDRITVEKHDRSSMTWLEYEDDNGEIQSLNASVNGTDSGAKVAYVPTKIDSEAMGAFPRTADEENNSVTWLDTSNWTSTSNVSVTDTDGTTGTGVDSIMVGTDGTLGSADSATATYDQPDITTDAEKRYLQFVANVDTLEAGAELTVQVHDSDGDYVQAVANSSQDTTADDVFANSTADGIVFQEQLGQLTVMGSGDGSLDAVQEVKVMADGGDANITITGLNVQKKSRWDFGDERVLDTETDDEDDYKDEAVYNHEGGEIEASSLAGMGDTFADATIVELDYISVEYRMQDDPSSSSVEFTTAEQYPNYEHKLVLTHTFKVPSAYDLTHGTMELTSEQSFLSDRYTRFRYAEGVGDTDAEDISSESWIDLSSSLGEEGDTITADSTVQPDTTYKFQLDVLLLEEQYNELQPTQESSGGFWGGSGGSNPFMSLYNWAAAGVTGLLVALGIAKKGA